MFSLASLPPSPRHKHTHKMGRPGKAGRAAQLEHIPAHTLSQITAQENGCEFYSRGATAKHLLLE